MQPTIHFLSIHKAIALAFSFTVCASESMPADEEISVRFVLFPKATDVKPLELLKSDAGAIEIKASTTHIPNAIQVPHIKEWNIGESDPDDQKPFSFSSYGKVDALDCKEQLVVILRQKPKEPKELKLIAFDNNVKDFKGGHYLVVNHSDKTITGVIGVRLTR